MRSTGGRRKKVTVEIGTPAAVPGSDWGCRVRIRGLSQPVDQTIFGIDSIQALGLALQYSGAALEASREFRTGRLVLWGQPVIDVLRLALPLPLLSVQGAFESLTAMLARTKAGLNVAAEWKRAMLAAMRETSAALSRLSE